VKNGKLCPSAPSAVPADAKSISGMKYQSAADEWSLGGNGVGFGCLGFELHEPQFFQYGYAATKTGFTVTAHGDLNGNGAVSTFELEGTIHGKEVRLSQIRETNPRE
jgi:hypothetical protein